MCKPFMIMCYHHCRPREANIFHGPYFPWPQVDETLSTSNIVLFCKKQFLCEVINKNKWNSHQYQIISFLKMSVSKRSIWHSLDHMLQTKSYHNNIYIWWWCFRHSMEKWYKWRYFHLVVYIKILLATQQQKVVEWLVMNWNDSEVLIT